MEVINEIISILTKKLPAEIARKIVFEGRCISSPSCKIIKPYITLIKLIPFEAIMSNNEKIIDLGEIIQIIPDFSKKLTKDCLIILKKRLENKERLKVDTTKTLCCLRLFYSTKKSITLYNTTFKYSGVSRILFFY